MERAIIATHYDEAKIVSFLLPLIRPFSRDIKNLVNDHTEVFPFTSLLYGLQYFDCR